MHLYYSIFIYTQLLLRMRNTVHIIPVSVQYRIFHNQALRAREEEERKKVEETKKKDDEEEEERRKKESGGWGIHRPVITREVV